MSTKNSERGRNVTASGAVRFCKCLNTILVEQDYRPRKERIQPKIDRFEWAVEAIRGMEWEEKVQKERSVPIEGLAGNLADHSGSGDIL